MYIFGAILGFAVGGASATVPVYLAETAPKRIRGAIVAVDQLMIVTGQLLAFSINALIATMRGGPKLSVTAGNGDTWRYMIVLCSIPAIALWIGIRLMPESSRW